MGSTPHRSGRPWCLLALVLLLAGPLSAAEKRTPEEAEKLFQQLGAQMTCTCGCREGLLVCSMNNCSAKAAEQGFLRELCADSSQSPESIRRAMALRFGEKILQTPDDTSLFPLLLISGLAVLAMFAGVLFYVRGRPRPAEAADTPKPSEDEMDARLKRELEELD
jgi:cytochrome c-type biogenesis protein CcmH/NrfF